MRVVDVAHDHHRVLRGIADVADPVHPAVQRRSTRLRVDPHAPGPLIRRQVQQRGKIFLAGVGPNDHRPNEATLNRSLVVSMMSPTDRFFSTTTPSNGDEPRRGPSPSPSASPVCRDAREPPAPCPGPPGSRPRAAARPPTSAPPAKRRSGRLRRSAPCRASSARGSPLGHTPWTSGRAFAGQREVARDRRSARSSSRPGPCSRPPP